MEPLDDQVLYVLDEGGVCLTGIFNSDERVRAVLPRGRDLCLITTSSSPGGGGEEIPDRLLRLRPAP